MTDAYYMDAVITPNRSLSQRGFIILISVITTLNVIAAAVFIWLDAHLVPFFLGADVIAITVAFLVNYAAARRVERVQVSAGEVRVTYETPKWRAVVWESPTAFTRVDVEKDEEDGRVTACRVTDPSPDPEADAITCRLASERFVFRPRLDASGQPVVGIYRWRQRWF